MDSIATQTIDVRTIPPRERHPLIFQTFDALKPGETFDLVNDHAPEPLYHQFLNKRTGQFTWVYLQEGPEVWRVRIGKETPASDDPGNYLFVPELMNLISEIPPDSIVSRTIANEPGAKTVLFGFAPGQSLSEHTSSVPAILHILSGEATLTLGGDTQEAHPGTWVSMPARLPHSVFAKTPVVMLLTMLQRK